MREGQLRSLRIDPPPKDSQNQFARFWRTQTRRYRSVCRRTVVSPQLGTLWRSSEPYGPMVKGNANWNVPLRNIFTCQFPGSCATSVPAMFNGAAAQPLPL